MKLEEIEPDQFEDIKDMLGFDPNTFSLEIKKRYNP